jgi:hypothetical protein
VRFWLVSIETTSRGIVIDHFIEKGYTEVVDCSGTGLGLCLFKFRNATGQTLSVTTANNAPEEESLVFGWSLESEKQSSTKTR